MATERISVGRLLTEASGYALASGIAFALDFALLAVLVSGLGVPYLPAATVSFVAGTLFVYWASVRRIFAARRVHDRRVELLVFMGIGVLTLAVNLGALYAAVEWLGLHYLLGKCCAGMITVGVNFGLRRWLLFTPASVGAPRAS